MRSVQSVRTNRRIRDLQLKMLKCWQRRHFYLDYLRLMVSTFTYSCRRTTCALFLRGFKGTKCRRTDAVSHMEQIRLDRQHRNEVLLLRTVDSRVFLSKVLRTKEGFSRSPVLFSGHPNSMRLSKSLNINKKWKKGLADRRLITSSFS